MKKLLYFLHIRIDETFYAGLSQIIDSGEESQLSFCRKTKRSADESVDLSWKIDAYWEVVHLLAYFVQPALALVLEKVLAVANTRLRHSVVIQRTTVQNDCSFADDAASSDSTRRSFDKV